MEPLEMGSELANDTIDKLRKLGQNLNDRLTLDNLRVAERYIKGEIELLILFRHHSGNDCTNYCAIFKHGRGIGTEGLRRADLKSDCLPACFLHVDDGASDAAKSDCGYQNEPVLVDNIKVMEHSEVSVPSLVWLDSLKNGRGSRVNSLYFGVRCGFTDFRSIVDGKTCMSIRSVPILFDQLPCQMVKGAAQIVDSIADDQGQFFGDGRTLMNPLDFVSTLKINLNSDSIRISIAKCFNDTF